MAAKFIWGAERPGLTRSQDDAGMQPTLRESAAALRLAESLIAFIVAVDEGMATRRASRPRDERSLRAERPPPPPLPAHGRGAALQVPEHGLLSARQAAKRLNISERSLWNLSAPRGPLPTVRIGGRVLYSASDLDVAIERLKTQPQSHTPRNSVP